MGSTLNNLRVKSFYFYISKLSLSASESLSIHFDLDIISVSGNLKEKSIFLDAFKHSSLLEYGILSSIFFESWLGLLNVNTIKRM
jgi:hypothetical protein